MEKRAHFFGNQTNFCKEANQKLARVFDKNELLGLILHMCVIRRDPWI